jgi:hypothetical protein
MTIVKGFKYECYNDSRYCAKKLWAW